MKKILINIAGTATYIEVSTDIFTELLACNMYTKDSYGDGFTITTGSLSVLLVNEEKLQ